MDSFLRRLLIGFVDAERLFLQMVLFTDRALARQPRTAHYNRTCAFSFERFMVARGIKTGAIPGGFS